jgi:hypothetical protein
MIPVHPIRAYLALGGDDFAGYDYLDQSPGIVHLGCWAHARRRFVKAVKMRKKHRSKRIIPKGLADDALDIVGRSGEMILPAVP